jgi:3-oxoacyl-[acyl-carrier-protein] synthase-3
VSRYGFPYRSIGELSFWKDKFTTVLNLAFNRSEFDFMASTITKSLIQEKWQAEHARQQVMGIKIAGTGSYVPENIVRNESLGRLGCDPEWIIQRTGIRERRHASPEQATSDLAYEAAINCLANASISIDEIDLIICGTISADYTVPGTACLLQDRLGARCGAFDLNAACSGFIYSLITGAQFIKSGCCRNAMVIGADIMSRIPNREDKKTYPLFGDAAGAVILSPADGINSGAPGGRTSGILSYTLGADGGLGKHLIIPCGGSREAPTVEAIQQGRHYLKMDGRPVFKWAVRKISESVREVVDQANLTINDIDLVILHQANIRIIDAAVQDLGLPEDKVFVNLQKYGNTSSGSIPLALDEAARAGLIHPGDRVVLCGFGAGLTWGACVLQW